MKDIIKTPLEGAYLLIPEVHYDLRGYFYESFSARELKGIVEGDFVQDNQSLSKDPGVLRGLHLQMGEHSQGKLVRVLRGKVLDVIVDVRKGSPSYLKWASFELSEENFHMLYVPRGFLHGFVTLTPDVIFSYKVDRYYDKGSERGVNYADPLFHIDWGVKNPILSEKDARNPFYKDSGIEFIYQGSKQ